MSVPFTIIEIRMPFVTLQLDALSYCPASFLGSALLVILNVALLQGGFIARVSRLVEGILMLRFWVSGD